MRVYWMEQDLPHLPADDHWLTTGESVRLATLHVPKRRAEWRLGRWTAKRAIVAYLEQESTASHIPATNVGYKDVELRPAPTGAPQVFLFGRAAPLAVSLTHSNGLSVCAVAASGMLLGCDLELVEPRSEVFLADYFTAEEQAFVAQSPSGGRDRLVTLFWSAKESALKALRTGLRLDTRDLIVTPDLGRSDEWHPLEVLYASDEIFHGWWCERENFILSLVGRPAPFVPGELGTCISADAGTR